MYRSIVSLSAALALIGCAAEAEEASLELSGRVVDDAQILSADFESDLSAKLAALESGTQAQLVVVTTPDLAGKDIADYSVDLARDWSIGSKERLDGLMLIVAPNERKVRIEVGYGLEASVKDDEAAEIIREAILPAFRKSDYESGISAGVDRLIDEVTPYELKEAA